MTEEQPNTNIKPQATQIPAVVENILPPVVKPPAVVDNNYKFQPVLDAPREFLIGPDLSEHPDRVGIANAFEEAQQAASIPLSQLYAAEDNNCPICGCIIKTEVAGLIIRNRQGFAVCRNCKDKSI